MSKQYNRFLKVLEKWPLDKSKAGRDLSEHLRKDIKNLANPSNLSKGTLIVITEQIDSLERLSNNIYAKKYPRTRQSTATGLTLEQCNQVLSSEFLQYLETENSK